MFFTTVAITQQSYVHQVIFLNEGWYDYVNDVQVIAPSVGSYDPATGIYRVFDEIPEANFASDVLVEDVIYVAAGNLLITYDKDDLTRLQTRSVPGIRKMAIWGDELIVSRGDYLVSFDSYLQVYDRHTLDLLYTLDTETGPQYTTEGIVVRGDLAYIAINNGFVFGEETGLIGILDLQSRTYLQEIDLGPDGINPDNIMQDAERIYTLNNKDFSGSSISLIDPYTHQVITYDQVAANAGCGTSVLADAHIYYMEYGVDKLARFDVHAAEIIDTLIHTTAYYGLIDDVLNQRLIATWTDFFSQGKAYFLSYDGAVQHTFDVGVSPGSIALDVRMTTGIAQTSPAGDIEIFPNPLSDRLNIRAEAEILDISIFNSMGQVLYRVSPHAYAVTLPLESSTAGILIVRLRTQSGTASYRLIRQE
jgi:hypothetical protein